MPKEPKVKASGNSGGGRGTLGRNQACIQCRRRKLKCDAQRPHCGTCTKKHEQDTSVPAPIGQVHPIAPKCHYDPVDGDIDDSADPSSKIRALEEQIALLKRQLNPSASSSSPTGSPHYRPSPHGVILDSFGQSSTPIDLPRIPPVNGFETHGVPGYDLSPEPHQEVLHAAWNVDLPPPSVLMRLVDVFFRCDPCGARILHEPDFRANLLLPPNNPSFPHAAILHAICASASRWASETALETQGGRRDPWAEFHAGKTRQYIDRTMATGQDIFHVLQACILLSWYFYTEGRWVEVWIFAAFQTRVAIPLRLNYPGTHTTQGRNAPGAYLPPPTSIQELETRRRTWWMCILFDRIVSAGGWLHSVDERDMGTEFPLRAEDFYCNRCKGANPQNMSSKDVLLVHPVEYTDSFILFLKSCLLFGKVTDYNVRNALHSTGTSPNNQDPFHLPGFAELDALVSVEFFARLPHQYAHCYNHNGSLDTDAYMCQVMPQAAVITLHTHYINFTEPNNVSTRRCMAAAHSILQAYFMVAGTSLDISRLHPFVTICWYLAAVVQIHLCKYYIEVNDHENEARTWQDINTLRFAMLNYGVRSPIGTRQEKLLQGMMTEIVNMTTQRQPLQVGVPLYPFSHRTAFAQDGVTPPDERVAPLPSSPAFETTGPKAPAPMGTASPTIPAAAWSTAVNAQMAANAHVHMVHAVPGMHIPGV